MKVWEDIISNDNVR